MKKFICCKVAAIEHATFQENELFRGFFFHKFSLLFSLKAHWEISKKRCFKKYYTYDQVCQFSALQCTPWPCYLDNLTIDDKFINKRVRLFLHQTMCREEKKILIRHNKVAKQLLNTVVLFQKNTEAATGDAEAATGGVL